MYVRGLLRDQDLVSKLAIMEAKIDMGLKKSLQSAQGKFEAQLIFKPRKEQG